MKIIQVIPHLGSGGAERLTVDLSNQLIKMGHGVIICVLSPLIQPYDFYKSQIDPNIKLISFNKKIGFSLRVLFELTHFIYKQKPDIVHSHLRALPYCIIADLFIAKGVHTIHSEAGVEAGGGINRFVRKLLFKTKRVQPVAISPESFDSFIRYYGYSPCLVENGRNIPQNLITSQSVKEEFQRFRRTNTTRIIVHLAHIDKVKRQVLHAKVANRLFHEGYDFSVLFIGSMSDTDYVKMVKKNSPPNVFFLGEKTNPLEYLKEADAFALTSLYEGLPMSLIEALGVGAIPVCMPVGGIPSLVRDGENGFLSMNLDEESFYHAEKRFLETPDQVIKTMRENAIASYEPYTMINCANNYLSIYYSV